MKESLIYRSAIILILLAAILEVVFVCLAADNKADPIELTNHGAGLYDLGMYNESRLSYEQAIKISLNNSDAWIGLGNVLFAMGRYNESIQVYDRALEIGKRKADAWYGKGNSLLRLGRNNEAISCYDRALAQKPGYPEAY